MAGSSKRPGLEEGLDGVDNLVLGVEDEEGAPLVEGETWGGRCPRPIISPTWTSSPSPMLI